WAPRDRFLTSAQTPADLFPPASPKNRYQTFPEDQRGAAAKTPGKIVPTKFRLSELEYRAPHCIRLLYPVDRPVEVLRFALSSPPEIRLDQRHGTAGKPRRADSAIYSVRGLDHRKISANRESSARVGLAQCL